MQFGICKLCKRTGVELQDSHLLPKAGYRLLTKSQGGESPVVMNSEVAILKDEQVRGHVFCKDCECRFNINGEAWVLKNCYRDGKGFTLKELLDNTVPEYEDGNRLKVFVSTQLNGVDIPKLAYFASSIFWKSSVHQWKSGKKALALPQLGPKYEEQFRRYLLGIADFPTNATLWLNIITDENLWNYFTFPYGKKETDYWRNEFQYFGIATTLFLGNLVPKGIKEFCCVHSSKHYISMNKSVDEMTGLHSKKLELKSKPVGALKNEFSSG